MIIQYSIGKFKNKFTIKKSCFSTRELKKIKAMFMTPNAIIFFKTMLCLMVFVRFWRIVEIIKGAFTSLSYVTTKTVKSEISKRYFKKKA